MVEEEDATPAVLTPGGSTPFRRGFVRNISTKWTEFHSVPRLYTRLTNSGRQVQDARPESATRVGINSFTRRRKLIEEQVGSPSKATLPPEGLQSL